MNSPVYAGEEKKDLPPRKISISPEYTGVVIPEGEDVSIDLTVANGGRQDENIEITLSSIPKGWTAWIKTYNFGVTGVHVASDSSKSLTLRAEPGDGVGPGKYTFFIEAKTSDKQLASSGQVTISVKEKEKVVKSKGIKIVTSYPVLQGPTDAKFEFSFEVENKSDKDTIFNLASEGPKNWEINFKPAYEDKYISSLRIKADQNQTMAVEVKPYILAEPGTYPIKIKVSSPESKTEAEITVVLTGTHKLEAGTANGLLSLNAFQGNEANLSFYVKNTGSAPQNNILFLSFKPENWKVDFKPAKIDSLAAGDLKQVEVTITPSDQALVGDYSVNLSIKGEKASKNLELRVTVRASTTWGWVGIGIIVLVIAGLVTLFIRMGRR
ncbi:MAG: NEW3 domain-containing protein [Thermodesulfobacteriota bacterium]|nr:NEW3 domain-containing protein [Thermodesulfobacteriota bacterium]